MKDKKPRNYTKLNILLFGYKMGVWECGCDCFLKCFSLEKILK